LITVVPYSDKYHAEWDKFVLSRPEATIAHQIGWRLAIAEGLGHKPFYLVALSGSDICGVLPLFFVKTWWQTKYLISMPWIDYGGILADSEIATEALLNEANRIAKETKAEFIEFRSVDPVTSELPIRTDKVTFQLSLQPDSELIWKSFNAKLRNQIRKAQKSELKTEFGSIDKLPEFYKVFSWKMHQLGTPVWGYKFFESILKHLGNSAEIILVRKDDKVIAGGLIISFADQLYVPSAASYSNILKFCPNHALYWGVIRRGCENGYNWFDFGRSTIDSNTYRFKKQWVPEPKQLHWQYYLNRCDKIPAINPDNEKYRIFINLWRKLPLSVANILGPKVIRNFP